MRIGLLPSAGTATRMSGLPKFLLPVSDTQQCLLDYHVALMSPHVDRIIIPTRPVWSELLHSFEFGPHVDVVDMTTNTMAETLKRSLADVDYDTCVLGMPDTYFVGGNPYEELHAQPRADVSLRVFATRPEQSGRVGSVLLGENHRVIDHADKEPDRDFGTHWGVIEFSREVEQFLSPEATTGGYLISEALSRDMDVRGYVAGYPYFDCGTFDEYVQCLTHLALPSLGDGR
jgi:hypothetical protein